MKAAFFVRARPSSWATIRKSNESTWEKASRSCRGEAATKLRRYSWGFGTEVIGSRLDGPASEQTPPESHAEADPHPGPGADGERPGAQQAGTTGDDQHRNGGKPGSGGVGFVGSPA